MKKKLFFIVLIFIAIMPKINIISISGNGAGIRVEDIILALLAVYYIIVIFINKTKKIESNELKNISKIFMIFLAITLISTIFGYFQGYIKLKLGALYFLRKIEYFLLLIVSYDIVINDMWNLKSFLKFVDIVVIFHFIYSILQLLGILGSFNRGEALSTLTQGRVSSTFNGAYELSAFLLLVMPIYLNKIIVEKKYKLKDIMCTLMIFFCILASDSRTSIIIFMFLIILFFTKEEKNKNKVALVWCIIIFLITTFSILTIDISDNLDDTRFATINISKMIRTTQDAWYHKDFDAYVMTGKWYGSYYNVNKLSSDASFTIRVNHWMQILDGLIRSPFIGVGASISGGSADGNYVRVLGESGILGFIFWIGMYIYILKILRNGKNGNKIEKITRYALISMLFGAIFIDVFEASKVMMFFWTMLGITLALREKDRVNDKEHSNNK